MLIAAQDEAARSPACVADAISSDSAAAIAKIGGPPMDVDGREPLDGAAPRAAGSSSPRSSAIDASENGKSGLVVSDDTRRMLEGMDEGQVKSAREGLKRVKLQRWRAGLASEDLGRFTREGSFRNLGGGRPAPAEESRGRDEGRRLSKSLGALPQLESFDDFSDDSSDDESDAGGYGEGYIGEVRMSSFYSNCKDEGGERRLSKSEGTTKEIPYQSMTSREMRQLREVDEIADETLERIFKRNSARDLTKDEGGEGPAEASWEPERIQIQARSHPSPSARLDKANGGAACWEESESGGIGGFWSKLAASLTSSLTMEAVATAPSYVEPERRLSAAACLRKGRKKAENCQFLPAVALFNLALVRQREELGEDHVDCGATLNDIGACWLILGERRPALTALEEALYIRHAHFGAGAREVAETMANIWMILHEEREEAESSAKEQDEEEEEEPIEMELAKIEQAATD